jgi:1,4-dihydroxy-2-naphthoate octaprenyltransferase
MNTATVLASAHRHSLRRGIWRLADPKVSLASAAAVFLGATAAARDGLISPGWLLLTMIGIFCVEVAKNASGEIYDFDSGADVMVPEKDRSPFSGGKRVLLDRLLTRRETWGVAIAGYATAIVLGLIIVVARDLDVLWLGVIGLVCAFFYHAPPVKLAYRGLGEIAVACCYGPLIAGGTYLVQRGEILGPVVPLSIALGTLIAAFLWINQLPDYSADVAAGKMNVVARIGRRTAGRVFSVLIAVPFVILALAPHLGSPPGVLLGLVGIVPGARAARIAWNSADDTPRLVGAQRATLATFLAFATGCGLGLLVY